MGKVQLRIPPWIASVLGEKDDSWFILEKEIGEGCTVGDLFGDLTAGNANFCKAVFNPDVGKVNEQLLVFLNDNLLEDSQVMEAKLSDGDSIMLLPVYSGG